MGCEQDTGAADDRRTIRTVGNLTAGVLDQCPELLSVHSDSACHLGPTRHPMVVPQPSVAGLGWTGDDHAARAAHHREWVAGPRAILATGVD